MQSHATCASPNVSNVSLISSMNLNIPRRRIKPGAGVTSSRPTHAPCGTASTLLSHGAAVTSPSTASRAGRCQHAVSIRDVTPRCRRGDGEVWAVSLPPRNVCHTAERTARRAGDRRWKSTCATAPHGRSLGQCRISDSPVHGGAPPLGHGVVEGCRNDTALYDADRGPRLAGHAADLGVKRLHAAGREGSAGLLRHQRATLVQ